MMLLLLPDGIGLIGTMVKKGRKRGMKVAIMTHFARMQQIDQFPSLLNKPKGFGYSLGSQFNHELSYVPMNWKRQMEKKLLHCIDQKWARNCKTYFQKLSSW